MRFGYIKKCVSYTHNTSMQSSENFFHLKTKFDMSKRDDLIQKYAAQLTEAGVDVDQDLLTKVTVGLGPSIYNADAATVSGTDPKELETVKKNYLIKKLGLSDGPELDQAIEKAVNTLGKSTRNKYRASIYYLLCKDLSRESVYK